VLLVGFLLALAGPGCSPRASPEPIWVGHVTPLSGPERLAGEQARQGVQLAVDEAREEDQAVEGRFVAVRHADSRSDERTARAEAVRLLAVNQVVALLAGPDPGSADVVVRAARPYSVPVIVPGEMAGDVPGDAFVLGARPASRGEALASYAAPRLGKRAAVLTASRNPVASAVANAFVRAWPRTRGSAVEEWSYSSPEDQAEVVKRVAAWKPDLILVTGSVRDLGQFRRRFRDIAVRGPILYGGPDAVPEALSREVPDETDLYLSTVYARQELTEQGKKFARRYQERFHEPPGLPAAEAYDAARWLIGVLVKAKATDAGRLLEALAAREPFEAVTGTVSWKERQPRRRVFVVRLEKGGAKVVRVFQPEGE
jgi:branched-chain amino acid transport system substrate-binding protein